jgi:hypothetical protein
LKKTTNSQVKMSSNKTCAANFEPTSKATLSVGVVAGAGKVTSSPAGITDCGFACSASFRVGFSVTLTATPDSGYAIGEWGGDCAGFFGNNATIVLTKAARCTVSFK